MRKNGKSCDAPGCTRNAIIARGGAEVCNLHYQRLLTHGSFELPVRPKSRECVCGVCGKPFDRGYAINSRRATKPQYCSGKCRAENRRRRAIETEQKRFWNLVEIRGPNDCWEWLSYRAPLGYGRFTRAERGATQMAHRIAWEFTKGAVPDGLFVCHKCDHPPCVNPNHMFLGTHQDNMDDAKTKGRMKGGGAKGEKSGKAKITAAEALAIYNSPLPTKHLAHSHNITPAAVRLIKTGKNWKHVTGAGGAGQ